MKLKILFGSIVFAFSFFAAYSQETKPTPNVRVFVTNTIPQPTATPTPLPKVVAASALPAPSPSATPNNSFVAPLTPPPAAIAPTFFKPLSFKQIKSKIEEAKRQMLARPVQTASVDSPFDTETIRIAFYDYTTAKVDYLITTKTDLLQTTTDTPLTSASGKPFTLRTVRANGVNTPVMIIDSQNLAHLPLLVQYPVEKNGRLAETAYYISTHPGIVTPEVVGAGRLYVHNTLDAARANLQKKGVFISPEVADAAERLVIVEHVDHQRFRNEYAPNIFNDIFALYALNEAQTYRYSVSSAGAGGMVQMIPSTYYIVRSRFYNAALTPDFVEGMRNHQNAAASMLLYMQMTWDDLISNETISGALENNIATPQELMSAGYNSNPARLAGYIKRGGANWKNLIPRETQIYLQINAAMDRFVPVIPRTK